MLTKGSFTRDAWNNLLRLLNIISRNQKAQRHVEESSRKDDRRRTCGVKIETGMFGFKKPERKVNLLFGFGCFVRPENKEHRMKFKVFASPVWKYPVWNGGSILLFSVSSANFLEGRVRLIRPSIVHSVCMHVLYIPFFFLAARWSRAKEHPIECEIVFQCSWLMRSLHVVTDFVPLYPFFKKWAQGACAGQGPELSNEFSREAPFPGTEKLVRSCVCERSVGTGKPLRGTENQLGMNNVDFHNVHISDERYIGKGFQNLRQKLILLESGQILDQKTYVLIFGVFMSTTMNTAAHLGPNYNGNLVSYRNTIFKEFKTLFDITQRLIFNHGFEILNVSTIEWSTLLHD